MSGMEINRSGGGLRRRFGSWPQARFAGLQGRGGSARRSDPARARATTDDSAAPRRVRVRPHNPSRAAARHCGNSRLAAYLELADPEAWIGVDYCQINLLV